MPVSARSVFADGLVDMKRPALAADGEPIRREMTGHIYRTEADCGRPKFDLPSLANLRGFCAAPLETKRQRLNTSAGTDFL